MSNLNPKCWWPNCECQTEKGDPCKYEDPDFYTRKAGERKMSEVKKSDADVLANGRDAMAWVEDFMAMCPGASKLDKGDVHAWFCNIVESQYVTRSDEDIFILDVRNELKRAREKFPSAVCCGLAMTEEAGELAQAMLKHAAGKWPQSRIYEEAVQVAVMAMRCALEGDESLKAIGYSEPTKANV